MSQKLIYHSSDGISFRVVSQIVGGYKIIGNWQLAIGHWAWGMGNIENLSFDYKEDNSNVTIFVTKLILAVNSA